MSQGFFEELGEVAKAVSPLGFETATPVDFYKVVERFEWLLLDRALELTGGDMAKAGRLLKMRGETVRGKLVRARRRVG